MSGGLGMRRERVKVALLVLLSALLVAGCAGFMGPPPTGIPPTLTLLQKAELTSLDFMERYAAQLKDAWALSALIVAKKATPGQVEVYRVKRQILIKAEKLVLGFDKLVKDGVIPGADKELEINNVLNELLAAGGV